jgi:hypothetical protein
MSLSTVVALLQAALMLLTAAQAPNVPQSLRDEATQVANQAITQATAALPPPQPLPPYTPNNFVNLTATQSQSSTSIPDMSEYTDSQHGFRIQYPNTLTRITNPAQMTTQSFFGPTFVQGFTPLVQFAIKEQSGFMVSHFIEADLQVSVASAPSLVNSCSSLYPDDGDLIVSHQGTVAINGVSFSEIDGGDAATSNVFYLHSFSAVHNGMCYKVEIVEQGVAYSATDADTLVTNFMPTVQSFQFTQ